MPKYGLSPEAKHPWMGGELWREKTRAEESVTGGWNQRYGPMEDRFTAYVDPEEKPAKQANTEPLFPSIQKKRSSAGSPFRSSQRTERSDRSRSSRGSASTTMSAREKESALLAMKQQIIDSLVQVEKSMVIEKQKRKKEALE